MSKEQSEPSLPDWLIPFLKPQPAEEDPFHVKGPKFLFPLIDKKEPFVITGTHHQGNLKYIGKATSQDLVKDVSLVKPTTKEPAKEEMDEEKRTSHKDSENHGGTWSVWLMILVLLWLFSLLLPRPSSHDWTRSPAPSPYPTPASPTIHCKTKSSSKTTSTPSTNVQVPIPKRIASLILQELSPFPSPSDQDMTPIIIDSATTMEDARVVDSMESKPTIERVPITVKQSVQEQELDDHSLFDPSNRQVCDRSSWQSILQRSCRIQRRQESTTTTTTTTTIIDDDSTSTTTTTPITVDQPSSSGEPCLNWLSRDCRVQKRALTESRSSSSSSTSGKRRNHPSSEPMFKEQTVQAVQSLLKAVDQTQKLVNLWIQEELETFHLVEPRDKNDN